MNKTFAEHVTNTAFFLSVSKRQIEALLLIEAFPYDGSGGLHARFSADVAMGTGQARPGNFIATNRALQDKGLTVRVIHDPIRGHGHEELTQAGRLLCGLLREAGFSLPSHINQEKVA